GDTPDQLPDSYVPPIIAILPRLAIKDPSLEKAAKKSATTIPSALEKHVTAAFTILGYQSAKGFGQGMGRVPDGIALDEDNAYAIIWDAKVRSDGYSMGTDDRTIRDYIVTQSRELKRRRTLRNIYYAIISSWFKDDYDDAIRSLKMETHVNEVCLIQADALVAMVDAKLREPLQMDLGPTGLQRLFCNSGVLTSEMVLETLA
ncbi:MAG: restriction endonuclease FokI C-terminal domain-containing protein, partial [Thermodesulfobacteriota bacterium]